MREINHLRRIIREKMGKARPFSRHPPLNPGLACISTRLFPLPPASRASRNAGLRPGATKPVGHTLLQYSFTPFRFHPSLPHSNTPFPLHSSSPEKLLLKYLVRIAFFTGNVLLFFRQSIRSIPECHSFGCRESIGLDFITLESKPLEAFSNLTEQTFHQGAVAICFVPVAAQMSMVTSTGFVLNHEY